MKCVASRGLIDRHITEPEVKLLHVIPRDHVFIPNNHFDCQFVLRKYTFPVSMILHTMFRLNPF